MSKTGDVYKLVCKDTQIKECYVGSTKNFTRRKQTHKSTCNNEKNKHYNLYVYQFIRENGGWENFDMIRIEEVKYDDKRELHTRERYWLETLMASLNKKIPTRTQKEWYIDNKEEVLERVKDYRESKPEIIKERKKKYAEQNKEQIAEYQKYYANVNKEKLKQYKKEKTTCICGSVFRKGEKSRHERTKKHKDYLTNHIIATENERNE